MNILGTILIATAMTLTGSNLKEKDKSQKSSSLEQASEGRVVTVKGKWKEDATASTATMKVGTCNGNGTCLTITYNDNNEITDVDLNNGVVISEGIIEIITSGNEYKISHTTE